MVEDAFLRFVWIIYVILNYYLQPTLIQTGISFYLDILFASLEIFRRFVWNIFRLENEQLSNVDQYRVTVDVPLPFERHSLITPKKSKFETFEDYLFKYCPSLLKEDDPFLDYQVNLDDFIKEAKKTLLGRKETLMKHDFNSNNKETFSLNIDDDDDLKVDKNLPRVESEFKFDSTGDTKDKQE